MLNNTVLFWFVVMIWNELIDKQTSLTESHVLIELPLPIQDKIKWFNSICLLTYWIGCSNPFTFAIVSFNSFSMHSIVSAFNSLILVTIVRLMHHIPKIIRSSTSFFLFRPRFRYMNNNLQVIDSMILSVTQFTFYLERLSLFLLVQNTK